MRQVLYFGYRILAITEKADVVWQSRARVSRLRRGREIELYDKSSFTNEREAENHALTIGRYWVDKRLQVRKRFVLTLSVLLWIVVAIGLLSIVLWIEHIGSLEEKLSKPN
jgi:hypothetical protein